jgi:parallel beta-helix repeat protein
MVQGYMVYRQDDVTVARGRVDGNVLIQDTDAIVVLQKTLDVLERNRGGELFIESGVYEINKSALVPGLVSVRGSGRSTVLKLGNENAEGVILIAKGKEGVVLSDFSCQGIASHDQSAGIILDSCGDCEIRNVYTRDFSGYGIWVRNGSFMNKLVNNTTSGNDQAGTCLMDNAEGGRGGNYVPNLIIGCTSIGEDGNAFELNLSQCTNIVGCQAYQPKGYGFYVRRQSNSTVLAGNRCFQGAKNGIIADCSHEINVTGNNICWNWGHGIELRGVTWGVISGNEFIDNGGRKEPRKYGIYVHTDTKCVQISGNAIFNWEGHQPMIAGIYESEDCRDNQIMDNVINYYTDKSVFSAGKNTKVANNMGIAEPYVHPSFEPFQPESKRQKLGLPFTHDTVQKFLDLTKQ